MAQTRVSEKSVLPRLDQLIRIPPLLTLLKCLVVVVDKESVMGARLSVLIHRALAATMIQVSSDQMLLTTGTHETYVYDIIFFFFGFETTGENLCEPEEDDEDSTSNDWDDDEDNTSDEDSEDDTSEEDMEAAAEPESFKSKFPHFKSVIRTSSNVVRQPLIKFSFI